jgi:hypothetical protein
MTTKPKTRKAPAAKPATPGEFASLPFDRTTASIRKLIARLHFLEADCRYTAALTPPDFPKHGALDIRHREERNEIIERLANVVPADDFEDAMTLLEFAAWRLKSSAVLDDRRPTIAMLKNCATAFMKIHVTLRVDNAFRRFDERRGQFAELDI